MATCVAHLVPARHEGAGRAVLWVCGRLFGPLGRSRRARLGVFRAGRGGGSGLGGRIAIDAWAIIAGPPGKEGGDQARACTRNKSAAGWVESTRPRSISCSLAVSQKPFTACASSPYVLSGPPGSSAGIVSTEASPRPTRGCDCILRILESVS